MIYLQSNEYTVTNAKGRYQVGTVSVDNTKQLSYARKGMLVGEFDGVRTFLNFLQDEMSKPKNSGSSSKEGRDDSFNSFSSYDEMMDTYLNHPEKVLTFEEVDEGTIEVWDEIGTNISYDVTGDFVDIGRYMHGVPEVFGSMHDGNPRRYRANLVLNLSWWQGVDHETIDERLKHLVATADWLEINGVRTAITAVSSQECSHAEIVVKDFDEVLDLRELAVVSHSDFLRRAIFRFDEYSETWDYGYGNARVFSHTNLDLTKNHQQESNVEFDIFIGSLQEDDSEYPENFKELRAKIKNNIENEELSRVEVLQ